MRASGVMIGVVVSLRAPMDKRQAGGGFGSLRAAGTPGVAENLKPCLVFRHYIMQPARLQCSIQPFMLGDSL